MIYDFYTPFFLLTVISYENKEENYILNLPNLTRYRFSKIYFDYLKLFVFDKIKFNFDNEMYIQRISEIEYHKLKELGTPYIKQISQEELPEVKKDCQQYNIQI